MPKLIILIGLLAMTNAYTYSACQQQPPRLYVPPETIAEAEYGRMVKEIAAAITPKGMM